MTIHQSFSTHIIAYIAISVILILTVETRISVGNRQQEFEVDGHGLPDEHQSTNEEDYDNLVRLVRSAPSDEVYKDGILRSVRSMQDSYPQLQAYGRSRMFDTRDKEMSMPLRSVPANGGEMIRTMRSGKSPDIRTDGILRSVRSGAPYDLFEKGILRSV